MGDELSENSRSRHCYKVLGVIWSGKTHIVAKAGNDKVQDYPTSGVRLCKDLGIWEYFYSPSGILPLSLITPGKERTSVGLGIRGSSIG